jgi:PmbA protein
MIVRMTGPQGFSYSRAQFQQIVDDALQIARKAGASDAAVEVSEGAGLSVSVRKGAWRTWSATATSRWASPSTWASGAAMPARRTSPRGAGADGAGRLRHRPLHGRGPGRRAARRAEDLATPAEVAIDLDLFHPWAIDAERRRRAGAALRGRGLGHQPPDHQLRRRGRVGAAVALLGRQQRGFRGGYASSRHYVSVSPIAGRGNGMQRD